MASKFTVPAVLAPVWILALSIIAPMTWAQELSILDPQNGAYVSGDYQVQLRYDSVSQVRQTRVFVNDALVFQTEGWSDKIRVNFGEGVNRRVIRAEVDLDDGSTLISTEVRTRELIVDFVATTRLIMVSAVVKGRGNKSLTGLEKKQFKVFENGAPLEVVSFERERRPLDLVLLVDTSSSLRDEIAAVRGAATAFVNELEPADRVMLFEFKAEPLPRTGFTNDRKMLMQAIAAFNSRGETALFDSLISGLSQLKSRQRGRRAIVLFTDGRDSLYGEPSVKANLLRRVIRQAQNREVSIFTIGLGKRIHRDALRAIALESGGRFYFAERGHHLPGIFRNIINDLKHQYVLGVTPQATAKGFHQLEVKVRKRGAQVYARKGYTLE